MFKDKICVLCGRTFTPKGGVAKYCKLPTEKICIVCGKSFTVPCHPKANDVCDNPECKKRAGFVAASKANTHKCRVCGETFIANSSRQLDCGKEITKICEICGRSYKTKCGLRWQGHTCENPKCRSAYTTKSQQAHFLSITRKCSFCGKEFHPVNNKQLICGNPHTVICKTCGKPFEVDAKYRPEEAPKYCSEECKHIGYLNRTPVVTPEGIEKMKQTKIARYGDNYGTIMWEKARKTYQERTGYKHQIYNPEVRSKQAITRNSSGLEQRIKALLETYEIKYIHHYMVNDGDLHHEYDFYIPKYKILMDADGVYFHSYISDPNGKQVRDDYDEIRLKLIPKDHIFHLIIEGYEDQGIKQLSEIIKAMDSNVFDYNTELFQWCRATGFPYPSYTIERMQKDYRSLCNYYKLDEYNPSSRLGESAIRNYHKSLYSAHCGNAISPLEGWNDDEILKKAILNRLIYVNNVDPSKVLKGLYISKLAPRVSVFNPVLAKYITNKYLSEYNTIFDPFSGYSGRLLGVTSLHKMYIGQDLNILAVNEANKLIHELNLQNCNVRNLDVLYDTGEYECLFTCPPYNKKEIYNTETEFKSCDDWITVCLTRYKCKKFVFVVDKTTKYSNHIVETIATTSHLSKVKEQIVVINNN